MTLTLLPAPNEIREVFNEAVRSVKGRVDGCYCTGDALFLRATLPETDQIQPRDTVRSGVALRTIESDIAVHPYVFRKVCSNGAILAQSVETRRIERVSFCSSDEGINNVLEAVREAVIGSAQGLAFRNAVGEMRAAVEAPADINMLLNMMPLLDGLGESAGSRVFRSIISTFTGSRGRSRYDLMNAVTSVARDTEDPELRWRLEELGGGVPAFVSSPIEPSDVAADLHTLEVV